MEEADSLKTKNGSKKLSTFKRKLASTAFLVCSGAVGYEYFFDNRYTIEQEYALIRACVTSNRGGYEGVTKACICALKETQKENKSIDDKSFGYTIKANYKKCR